MPQEREETTMAAMSDRDRELLRKARKYRNLKAKISELEEEAKELKGDIIYLLGEDDSYVGTNIKIQQYVRTTWTFDRDKLKVMLGVSDLHPYQNKSMGTVLVVK